jgi:hypothetical protein
MAESFLFLSALNSLGLMSLAPEVVLENDIFDSGKLHGFLERLGFQLQNERKQQFIFKSKNLKRIRNMFLFKLRLNSIFNNLRNYFTKNKNILRRGRSQGCLT